MDLLNFGGGIQHRFVKLSLTLQERSLKTLGNMKYRHNWAISQKNHYCPKSLNFNLEALCSGHTQN